MKKWEVPVWRIGEAGGSALSQAALQKKKLRDRIAELERKNKDLQMENDLLKKVRELERRDRLSLIHKLCEYQAIRELSKSKGYPVKQMCRYLGITRSSYYRWLKHPKRDNEIGMNRLPILSGKYVGHPDMGYRRIRDELAVNYGIPANDKRILRICRKIGIQSSIKWKPKSCTKADRNPSHIAKNFLHREFHADKPNEKWLTDVTEFKYYIGVEVHKIYLSAILDLCDRRIVSYKISAHNDNALVMDTFDQGGNGRA